MLKIPAKRKSSVTISASSHSWYPKVPLKSNGSSPPSYQRAPQTSSEIQRGSPVTSFQRSLSVPSLRRYYIRNQLRKMSKIWYGTTLIDTARMQACEMRLASAGAYDTRRYSTSNVSFLLSKISISTVRSLRQSCE
jgi:hypothetical protein